MKLCDIERFKREMKNTKKIALENYRVQAFSNQFSSDDKKNTGFKIAIVVMYNQ